jgi:hypothetical protein
MSEQYIVKFGDATYANPYEEELLKKNMMLIKKSDEYVNGIISKIIPLKNSIKVIFSDKSYIFLENDDGSVRMFINLKIKTASDWFDEIKGLGEREETFAKNGPINEQKEFKNGKFSESDLQEEDFDSEQVSSGIKVEREHTTDDDLAKKITLDHLVEHPYYYVFLSFIERLMEKSKDIEKDELEEKLKKLEGEFE